MDLLPVNVVMALLMGSCIALSHTSFVKTSLSEH